MGVSDAVHGFLCKTILKCDGGDDIDWDKVYAIAAKANQHVADYDKFKTTATELNEFSEKIKTGEYQVADLTQMASYKLIMAKYPITGSTDGLSDALKIACITDDAAKKLSEFVAADAKFFKGVIDMLPKSPAEKDSGRYDFGKIREILHAEGLSEGAEAVSNTAENVGKVTKFLDTASQVVAVVNAVIDCSDATQAYLNSSDPGKRLTPDDASPVEAWATSIGTVFGAQATLVQTAADAMGLPLLGVYAQYLNVVPVVIKTVIQIFRAYDGQVQAAMALGKEGGTGTSQATLGAGQSSQQSGIAQPPPPTTTFVHERANTAGHSGAFEPR